MSLAERKVLVVVILYALGFNKEKIIQISKGFKIEDIFELHEGSFPRKLFVVTQRKKRIWNF